MVKASNIQSLPDKLSRKLREPSAWSALISLGLHGIFFILLPILPFAAREVTEPEIRRPVALLELTPEEQSRLPNFSTVPPPELPPSQPDDLFSLSPFPPVPPADPPQGLPPLNFPPAPPLLFAPFPSPPAAIAPSPRPTPSVTPSPSPTASPTPTSPTPAPTDSPSPEASPTPNRERIGSVTDLGPAVSANPDAPADDPEAEPLETPQANDTPTPTPTPTPDQRQALLQEQQQLRALYTYNQEGTSNGAAQQTYTDWFQDAVAWLGEDYEGENAERHAEISGAYPPAACIRRLTATALVGVLVNAEGEVATEPAPEIIQSSGYGIFNKRALEAVQNYEFEPTDSKKAYLVPVKFEPNDEDCPSRPTTPPSQNS